MVKQGMRLTLLLSALLLAACQHAPTYDDAQKSSFIEYNQQAADALLSQNNRSGQAEILPPETILVTTLVNVDNVQQSSRLGRSVAEQLGARLTNLGYQVVDLRLRQAGVLIKQDTGELALSRDVQALASTHQARAILVGTYAEAIDMVYITLKMLEANSGRVMMAYNYALPLDKNNLALLRQDHRR